MPAFIRRRCLYRLRFLGSIETYLILLIQPGQLGSFRERDDEHTVAFLRLEPKLLLGNPANPLHGHLSVILLPMPVRKASGDLLDREPPVVGRGRAVQDAIAPPPRYERPLRASADG